MIQSENYISLGIYYVILSLKLSQMISIYNHYHLIPYPSHNDLILELTSRFAFIVLEMWIKFQLCLGFSAKYLHFVLI